MKSEFQYTSYAQEVIFGAGALGRLSEAVERFGWQRLLLCASGSARRNGTIERVKDALGERLVAVYDCVQQHVQDFQVVEALALADAERNQTLKGVPVDAVIGLGGGSPIGMAKALSRALEASLESTAFKPQGGTATWDVPDVPKRTGQPSRATAPTDQPLIPVIAIPTTYAGSEMTPVYGITRHSDGTARKVTVGDVKIAPKLVIYDPLLTLDVPPELTASSGINALAHCVEAVYSLTRNPLSTAAALNGTKYIARALPRCYSSGNDLDARTEMQIGAHLAGLALASVAMGLHHGLCHVLGGTAGVPHGIANAIILPHAMRFNADACAGELAEIAEALGVPREQRSDNDLALEAAQYVYDLVAQINLPQHLRDVHVNENDLPRLAELAAASRTVQNNPKPVYAAQIETLLRDAW